MPRGKSTGKRPDGRYMFQTSYKGKRYTVYGKTRKEALAKLDALKASIKAGLPAPDEQQTIETYLNSWLKTMQSQIDESSWIRYESDVRVHLIPAFGALLLPQVTSLMVQNFDNEKLKTLAPATVRRIHGILHHALDDAVRLSLLEKNAASHLYVRAPKLVKHPVKVLTEEETHAFLEAAKDDRLYALFLIAVKLGPRVGELAALHWSEINLPEQLLTVKYGFQQSKHGVRGVKLDAPKSNYGTRTIKLPPSVIAALEVHRDRQNFEKKRAGTAYQDSGFAFCDELGRFYTPAQIRTRFEVYVTKPPEKQRKDNRGRKPVMTYQPVLPTGTVFHRLRKTARTRMTELGIDPGTSAAILGHGVDVSLEVYTQVTPRMLQKAADLIDQNGEQEAPPENKKRAKE